MTPTRPARQIAAAIHCQNAASYLRLARLTGARAKTYESIYKTGDIEQWAKRHARTQIEMANEKAGELAFDVLSVEAGWSDALHEMGLSGNVRIVGTTKTEQARERTPAYAAWWRSLMTPPYNKDKNAEHEALAVASHDAWVTFETSREAWATLGNSVQATHTMEATYADDN